MRILGVAGAIRQAIQDLILPEFEFIKGEIKRLDEKIDSTRNELKAEICRVDEKLSTEIKRLDEKIDSVRGEIQALDRKLDATLRFHERLARLEAKVGIME